MTSAGKLFEIFDWESHFYKKIKNTPEYEEQIRVLTEILKSEEIEYKFGKKGLAFFFFLSEWAKYVQKVAVIRNSVPW